MTAGTGVARERQVHPEQGPHRVADRRHRHPPQHRRGRDGRRRHDEQRRHGAADHRRHVGHRSRGRGGRDRHPDRHARPAGEGDDRRDARQDVPRQGRPRSATARFRRPPARRPRHRRRTSWSRCTIDDEIADVRPGFTCTAEITTATRKNVGLGADSGDDGSRSRRRQGRQHGPRAQDDDKRPRRSTGVEASELKPGQPRKELEGVFVVRDNKAEFVPVKTGIAGEKYFEVLSGLKAGDQVIVGPFASVRELADGAPSRSKRRSDRRQRRHKTSLQRPAPRQSRRSNLRSWNWHWSCMHQFLEAAFIALERDLGEQAALVPHRAREHRRGDVDHRRGVARPGHERLRDRRHRLGRRRRQLHHPADAADPDPGRRRARPQQPARHDGRGGGGPEVQREHRRGRGRGRRRGR